MAARVTLKAVNDELARCGHHARLEKASGYFYFWSEDSADWIDRTVRVARLNSLTLDQWVGEYSVAEEGQHGDDEAGSREALDQTLMPASF
jgi:hypothetical protein